LRVLPFCACGARLARRFVIAATIVSAPSLASAQSRVVPYAGLSPGLSSKAEVDLSLGEPLRRLTPTDEAYEYAPPRGADDTSKVVVEFWVDTMQIARIDVYPKTPPASAPIREQFGTRVIARQRADGRSEELFYPSMLGMILTGREADASVAAVSYLSTRTLAAVYATRAFDALAARRLSEARTEADKAVLIDPDYGNGYLVQGQYFEAAGDAAEAFARYTLATRSRYGPYHRAAAHAGIGRLYEGPLKAPEKARAEFDLAIETATGRYRDAARVWLAQYLSRQKKDDEALAEYRRALTENPANRSAERGAAAILYDKDLYREALPLYRSLSTWAEETKPADGATLMARYGYCLGQLNQRREAIAWYQKALDAGYDKKASLLGNLAYEHRQLGEFQKALDVAEQGLAFEARDRFLNAGRTQALLGLGRFSDALAQAQTALSVDPQNGFRMLDLARAYGGLRKKKDALVWATKAVEAGVRHQPSLTADPLLGLIQNDGNYRRLIAGLK
jgi:tetratricopeptide (TPR) repeat protein